MTEFDRKIKKLSEDINCNENIKLTDGQMLMPLKTAALILALDTRAHSDIKKLCSSCAACKNLSCPSRKKQAAPLPHTYGAMQIFS